jgi:hypothetical protein
MAGQVQTTGAPHTTRYVSSYCCMCPHNAVCVRILLYTCRHTALHMLLIPVYTCAECVRILLYMFPHTAVNVCAYSYVCVVVQEEDLAR